MKFTRLSAVLTIACAVILFSLAIMPISAKAATSETPVTLVKEWHVRWLYSPDMSEQPPVLDSSWHYATSSHPMTQMPEDAIGAWIHIALPPTDRYLQPGVLIHRLYGLHISAYENSQLVAESRRTFHFEQNNLLIPVSSSPAANHLYIRIESETFAGPVSSVRIGEYNSLTKYSIRKELPDLLLGSSFALLGFFMLICSGYVHRGLRRVWAALSLIALPAGAIMITYSSLPYRYFPEYGPAMLFVFDISLLVIFPAFQSFVVSTLDGRFPIYTKMGKWMSGYYALCLAITILYNLVGESVFFLYKLLTFQILGFVILAHLISITVLTILSAIKGNKSSLILSSGIVVLAMSGVIDMILLYFNENGYVFILWKFGVLGLMASLILILARRVSSDYGKLLSYSKELELYNRQIQKSEKMQIISDLAASIAHEVRNPMQVTRGFLQLLARKADMDNHQHIMMAISELDRASGIITDFLTFAKPTLEEIVRINVNQELQAIEKIMSPLAVLNGGRLRVTLTGNLEIMGNPSKFKQAFINIIKNSIESLQEDGIIQLDAWADEGEVFICIKDNGEGMRQEQIAKLGEPYFSTKTKGTGLGLMVTFRIIEVMQGSLVFRSDTGKGTEAVARFPIAEKFK